MEYTSEPKAIISFALKADLKSINGLHARREGMGSVVRDWGVMVDPLER